MGSLHKNEGCLSHKKEKNGVSLGYQKFVTRFKEKGWFLCVCASISEEDDDDDGTKGDDDMKHLFPLFRRQPPLFLCGGGDGFLKRGGGGERGVWRESGGGGVGIGGGRVLQGKRKWKRKKVRLRMGL